MSVLTRPTTFGEPVDTEPAIVPEPTTLVGKQVALVPLSPEHAPSLWDAVRGADNDYLWAGLFYGPFDTAAAFDAHIARLAQSRDPLYFAVVPAASAHAAAAEQVVLGHVSLMRVDAPNRVVEVGNILYAPALQRTRAATEVQWLLARHVFGALRFRRYEWKCHALNAPSRAAALRLGFVHEGVFRQHMIIKGRTRDTAWYAIIDGDWPKARDGLERWLEDGNFNGEGKQKKRLEELRGR